MPELWISLAIAMVAGALIGYVTNALAIRMLFRPYKEIRIGRFTVPFTPGIIPKQRERLAASLGHMVSHSLFNPESLDRHISSPLVRDKIEKGVIQGLGVIAGQPREKIPGQSLATGIFGSREDQERLLSALVVTVVQSPRFRQALDGGARGLVRVFGGLPLATLLPSPEDRSSFLSGIERQGLKPGPTQAGQRILSLVIADFFDRDDSIESMVGEGFASELRQFIGGLYPEAGNLLLSWLESPRMRSELTGRGRTLLKQIFEKLNMPQRLLMGMVGYDRRLDDMMPSIIDDVLQELRTALASDKVRTAFLDACDRVLAGFLPLNPRESIKRLGLEPDALAARLMEWVAGRPGRIGLVLRFVSGLFDLLERNGDKKLGLALEELIGIEPGQLEGYVAERARIMLDKPDSVQGFIDTIIKLIFQVARLGSDGSILAETCPSDGGVSPELARELSAAGLRLLRLWLPHLVKEFDIEAMVRDRVRELDMAELEKMIMGLARTELEWINILGAILGGLIGLVQVVLTRLLG